MKKIVIILFLVIFLFNTVGYYIAFKVVQVEIKSEIKNEVEHGVNVNALIAVTITKNNVHDVEWADNGQEIILNGQYYDVVKSKKCSDGITYYCINDKQEDILNSTLDEHINTNVIDRQPVKDSSGKKLVDHVIKLYFSNEQSFSYVPLQLEKQFSSIDSFYVSILIETNSPPPEFV